jgi:hypothetical protein
MAGAARIVAGDSELKLAGLDGGVRRHGFHDATPLLGGDG